MRSLKVSLKDKEYNIIIEKGLLDNSGKEIRKIFNGKKIAVITDNNVNKYYGDKFENILKEEGYDVKRIILPAGEKTKSFFSLPLIYDELIDFKLTRSDLIVTLGGGVIGDLGGFAAATFLRGVKFVQFPTSLLSQVDSSVGGKVAVDLDKGKNLVGAFYHPELVLIDSNMLETLNDRVFSDGMAEVIKYGLIRDEDLFNLLDHCGSREGVMNHIDEVIYRCCDIKRQVVEVDEKDTGDRMILNFGHTLGHAIEKYFNYEKYTHGEAIAIGMYEISKIGERENLTKIGVSEKIKNIFSKYNLPVNVEIEDKSQIIDTISLDKKNINNVLNVILLHDIGDGFIKQSDSSFFK